MKLTKSQMQAQFMHDIQSWLEESYATQEPRFIVRGEWIAIETFVAKAPRASHIVEYTTDRVGRTLRVEHEDPHHPYLTLDWCEEDILHG